MSNFRVLILILLLGMFSLMGCSQHLPSETSEAKEILEVTVSILPQKYFVERIGGDTVNVNVMVKPGANPATYEPKPEQLRALSNTQAYLTIGVPFEKAWLPRIASVNSKMIFVDTTESIPLQPIANHHHHHGEEEQHHEEEENLDPHIWLSPKLVKIQAQIIKDALVELEPENKTEYQANLESFLADIDQLDAEIRKRLQGIKNHKFMVFHPSWGYFARDYGLEMIAIEIGGTEPSASELAKLISEAKEENIKIIFAQPEFNTESAETIAKEIGGEVLLISPLAPDWLNNLRQVAKKFSEVLKSQSNVLQVKDDLLGAIPDLFSYPSSDKVHYG
ncbi:MAG: zinc ABC transporter solute-binding protein [Moorea sp. SIO2B7]|nr:zinc ABC transporter solute-binding protein [Moorena sp. SIO2B7]